MPTSVPHPANFWPTSGPLFAHVRPTSGRLPADLWPTSTRNHYITYFRLISRTLPGPLNFHLLSTQSIQILKKNIFWLETKKLKF